MKKRMTYETTIIWNASTFLREMEHYMSIDYPLLVEKVDENGATKYIISITDLPGCKAEGLTLEKAHERLEKAKEAWFSANLLKGNPIPEPGRTFFL